MQQGSMELLWRSSHISGGNAVYVEAMYEAYLRDPNSIAAEWREVPRQGLRDPQVDRAHAQGQRQQAIRIGGAPPWVGVVAWMADVLRASSTTSPVPKVATSLPAMYACTLPRTVFEV